MLTHTPLPYEKRRLLPILERNEPVIQDHSATKLYKTCPYKYFLRIVLGRSPKKSGLDAVFSWGSGYHKYREVFEREFTEHKDIDKAHKVAAIAAISIFKAWPAGVPGKWSHYTMANFLKMLAVGFTAVKAEKAAGNIHVVELPEQPFNLSLPDGTIIGGRYDQIIRWGGSLWVRDFKTTSKKKEYFTRGLNPNDQATRYIYALGKLSGERINGVYYDIIHTFTEGKGQEKIAKTEIYVFPTGRSAEQLKNWELDQMEYSKKLAYARENDVYEMNEEACAFCDYHQVCKLNSSYAQVNMLKTMYEHKPWNFEKVEQALVEG